MILAKLMNFLEECKYKLSKLAIASSVLAVNSLAIAPVQAANLIDTTYGVGAGSFELGNFINNGSDFMALAPGDSTTLTGWTVGGPGDGVDWQTKPAYNPDTGIYSLDLQHFLASSIFTTIPTVIGNIYELSFTTATVTPFTIQGSVSAGSLVNQPFTAIPSNNLTTQTFTPFTFQFTAINSTTIIQFASTGPNTAYGPAIDSVSVELVQSVPEPSSILGILSLGVLGIGTAFNFKI